MHSTTGDSMRLPVAITNLGLLGSSRDMVTTAAPPVVSQLLVMSGEGVCPGSQLMLALHICPERRTQSFLGSSFRNR
jgi:hypothetical protein